MALINEHTQGNNVRRNYKKYTDEDRYKIGNFASESGSAATVWKFKSDFPKECCSWFQKKIGRKAEDFKKKKVKILAL